MAAACLAMCSRAAPCKDRRISSGAVKPRWRIWLSAFTLVERAERLATISARIASTCAVAVLGLPQLAVPLGGMGGLDGVHGVGLAFAATLLAVGAVHLHHLHPRPAQVTGQAGPVAAGALHPDPHHRAEAGQPTQQLAVTRRRGRKLLHPQQPTDPVQRRGHVHLQMGIHATRDRARGIYSCHGHPFLYLSVRGGRPPSCGGCDRPVGAGRSAALS